MTLRIAMILNRYLPIIGGAERQASHLIRQLTENGHQVSVITRRINKELPLVEEIEGTEVKRLHPIGLSHRSNILMVFRLFVYLVTNAHQYDIFHVHSIGPVGIATILAGKVTRTPVVLKIATAGDIARKRGAELTKITSFIRKYLLPQKLWLNILGQASAIVTMTDEIIAEAKAHQLDKITHKIPNGVELFDLLPKTSEKSRLCQSLNISIDATLIFFAGRLVQRKQVDVLIEAFHILCQTHPNTYLLLAGSGHLQADSVEEQLREQVTQLDLSDNVTFLGLVDDIPQYLQAVDLFAFPSAKEGMPNVVLEAMAYQLPIVACQIGGVMDVVDEESAYLVPVGDINAFVEAMSDIINHPEIARRKADKARERAETEFSLVTVAEQYESLYHSLIN